ncbi:MAG: hypothetical protein JNL90_13990 [Planctomycetes bacterium]|nr:hypothetical protein [Planctomycetota bacterium]
MVERTATLVDVTRDEPCPGRREELLSLAALREQSPTQASARRHVASCRRCAAFLSSVQLELRLGVDAFSELRARHAARTAPPFDLARSKSFTAWLEGELEERSELELARALTRAASWLHRLDPEVASRVTVEDSRPWFSSESIAAPLLASVVATISRLISGSPGGRHRRGAQLPNEQSSVDLQRVLQQAITTTPRFRITVARSLVDAALSISDGKCGAAWLTLALLEWFDGDDKRVPTLLSRAERDASDDHVRAASLVNFGIYSTDHGSMSEGFEFLHRAITLASPTVRRSIHSTTALWLASCDRPDEAVREINKIRAIDRIMEARKRLSPRIARNVIQKFGTRAGLTSGQVESNARRVLEALHGTH